MSPTYSPSLLSFYITPPQPEPTLFPYTTLFRSVTETPLNALEKVPVFFGGLVGRDRLIFASLVWKTGEGLKLNHNVAAEEANEKLGKDPNSVRAFIGYAGWGSCQLEAEMKQNGWAIRKLNSAAM